MITCVQFLLWSLVAGLLPSFGSDPLQETFPVEASGNIRFQADAARFRGPEGIVTEVAISVPRDSLFAPGDSAHLAVEITPLDRKRHALASFRTELRLPPAPSRTEGGFPVPRGWLRLSPRWVDGTVALRVRVEDLDRVKRGLYDKIRGNHPDGEASARLAPVGAEAGLGCLSDILFAWGPSASVDAGASDGGLRGVRARLEPNPYRYYGLFQPVLTAYWERYPLAESAGEGPLVERRRVVRLADSVEVATEAETLAIGPDSGWMLRRYDLSSLAGGAYRFEVELSGTGAGAAPLARTAGDFQVVWEERNWLRADAELREIARVVLPWADFEQFERLDRGRQETFLRQFWNRHAEVGPGGVNPLERTFEDRRRYADRSFHGLRSGMMSDRGRVFIRLGPADEVQAQLNPQDEELLWLTLPGEMADDGEFDGVERERLSKRRTRYDNSAYEIWTYQTRGDPLLPEYIAPGQKLGLKFIFVDELGTGDYALVYTNAPGTLQ
jgi:GWxTD domain-containing protein